MDRKHALLVIAAVLVGCVLSARHGYRIGEREGFDSAAKRYYDGAVNAFGNLPYTQGSLDAERRMQLEAVRVGAARIDSDGKNGVTASFVWKNEPTVSYPAIKLQYDE